MTKMFRAASILHKHLHSSVVGISHPFSTSHRATAKGSGGGAGKWLKRLAIVAGTITVGFGLSFYFTVKKFLTLRYYLTDEEIDDIRKRSQAKIERVQGPLSPGVLGTIIAESLRVYIPKIQQREKDASAEVRKQYESRAAEEMAEFFSPAFRGDSERSTVAMWKPVLTLVYTPEQAELLAKSTEARDLVMQFKVPTAEEVERLREHPLKADEPPSEGQA